MSVPVRPLISVVIPTYNHAHFIGRALQSVLDQTYENWEAIIIDNYSQDNTDEVVQGFTDPRISLMKIHNDGVIAASRNMGIRAAKGEWIAFLDSDDLWYPKKLETAVKGIQAAPYIDVCTTNEIIVDEMTGSRKLARYGPYCLKFYQRLLVLGNCLSPSATLVRRNFLSGNDILFREVAEFVTAEDYDFWMLLARAGANFGFIDSAQGEYIIHANNNSGQIERHRQNGINVLRDHVYQLQRFQLDKNKLWHQINSRLLLVRAKSLIENRELVSGIHVLISAARTSFYGCVRYIIFKFARGSRDLIISFRRK